MVWIICNFFTWSSEPLWKLPTIGWSAQTWLGHLESCSAGARQDFLLKECWKIFLSYISSWIKIFIMIASMALSKPWILHSQETNICWMRRKWKGCFAEADLNLCYLICMCSDMRDSANKTKGWGWLKYLLSDIDIACVFEIVQTRFVVQGFHPNLKF